VFDGSGSYPRECGAGTLSGVGIDLAVEASAPHRNAKKILAPDSEA